MMPRSRGGGYVPLCRGGRGAGSAPPEDGSVDDLGDRRGAPRARVANSGQNANSAEMEAGLEVAFASFSQSSAAASSSETAAVQLRTPDASPRPRAPVAATLSYDSSPGTEVSQLRASQRSSPGNSSQGIISPTVASGLRAGAAYGADEGTADEPEPAAENLDDDTESIGESAGAAAAGARSSNLTGRVSPHLIVSAFGFTDLSQFKHI